MKLAIFGGDQRQVFMARKLAEFGHQAFVWGIGSCKNDIGDATLCAGWNEALEASEAVILPLPASLDGVRVYCPLQSEDVFLRIPTLLDMLDGRLLLGGRFSDALRGIAEQKGAKWIDYFESEVLQLKNALPTAEGAISIAMQELPVVLDGTSVAVLGYGRIGSLLAEKLYGLGAQVTVLARRQEQLALARLHHHSVARLHCQDGHTVADLFPRECRVIFNTIPYRLLGYDVLSRLPKNCVLIDLASAPGGIDHKAAEALGLRSIWGTSLPGRCTPESAGYILAEVIDEILSELD